MVSVRNGVLFTKAAGRRGSSPTPSCMCTTQNYPGCTHLDVKRLEEEEHLLETSGRNRWQIAGPFTDGDYIFLTAARK